MGPRSSGLFHLNDSRVLSCPALTTTSKALLGAG
jgi:hypothetical protein